MSLRTGNSPLISGAVIASFLAMSIGGVAHHAVERHQRCAEHGELIHVEVAGGTVVVEASANPAIERGDLQQEDAHDHCDIAMASRDHATAPGGDTPTCVDLEDQPAASIAPRLAASGPARYRLAPKTSPPA